MSQVIDKLAWIHIVDQKILGTLSKGKNTYYIPGGKREAGETDLQALSREVQEELRVTLIADSVRYVGTFEAQAHGKPEGTIVRMTCYTGDYRGEIEAASEIAEVIWLEYADREKTSPVDQIIFDWLRERHLLA
jgi:8-oxo-dGTP pyrophosphatase MutT (NUDIX family)